MNSTEVERASRFMQYGKPINKSVMNCLVKFFDIAPLSELRSKIYQRIFLVKTSDKTINNYNIYGLLDLDKPELVYLSTRSKMVFLTQCCLNGIGCDIFELDLLDSLEPFHIDGQMDNSNQLTVEKNGRIR